MRWRFYYSKRRKCLCGTYIIARWIGAFYIFMFILLYSFDGINLSRFQYPFHNVSAIVREIDLNGSSKSRTINPYPNNITFFKSTSVFDACKTFKAVQTTLLIAVKSYVGNFDQRNSIRTTWGKIDDDAIKKLSVFTGVQIKVIFFVGYQSHVQYLLKPEALAQKDIVQGSFPDTYDNNIFKTFMTYQWLTRYCSEAKYICFSDDDFFLNLGNIVNFMLSNKDLQNDNTVMYGESVAHGRPNRSPKSKWFVSSNEYWPLWFPRYEGGGTILTNRRVVKMLHSAFPYVKHMHIDDAFIGIVAYLLGITLKHDYRFSLSKHREPQYMDKYFASHFYGDRLALIKGWKIFKANNFTKNWIPNSI